MNFLPERGFFPFSPTPFWQREKKKRQEEELKVSKLPRRK